MDSSGSITYWITQLKARDPEAAHRVWERYFARLVSLARKRLAGLPPAVEDEEDLALSALFSLVRGAPDGAFARLDDRHDLWQVLVRLTECKIISLKRHELAQKRDRRRRQTETATNDDSSPDPALIDQLPDPQPTPEMVVMLHEELQQRLEQLGDEHTRAIALLKLQGYLNEEIAERIDRPLRTVERKLRVIRLTWEKEISP